MQGHLLFQLALAVKKNKKKLDALTSTGFFLAASLFSFILPSGLNKNECTAAAHPQSKLTVQFKNRFWSILFQAQQSAVRCLLLLSNKSRKTNFF